MLSILGRHRTLTLLIVIEVALACAVLSNVAFMLSHRLREMSRPDAIDERGISLVRVSGGDAHRLASQVPANLAALRSIPGVRAVSLMNALPLSGFNYRTAFSAAPNGPRNEALSVPMYWMTSDGANALGLRLLAGPGFGAADYARSALRGPDPSSPVVMVTHALAQRLWPGRKAVGRLLHHGKSAPYTVVGVVSDVLTPSLGNGPIHDVVFFPVGEIAPERIGEMSFYVLRSAPDARANVLAEATRLLRKLNPEASTVKGSTFAQSRAQYFAGVRRMVWLLLVVSGLTLGFTALGVFGLSSFWVQQRTRQIGIRRALGATRRDILRYFLTENFLLTTFGILLGLVLAYGINLGLMRHAEMARLPVLYFALGAVLMWLVGQAAVLVPALRASAVPPAVATRGG